MPKNDIKNKFKNQRKPTQEELDAMDNYNKPLKPQPAIMRYYPEKDYKPEAKPFPFYEDKDYKPEAKPFPFYEDETLKSKRKGGMMKKAKDMSAKHEGMESMADEAKETRLEKKGYVETKFGKMKKPKKAFMGLAVEAARKSPMGLIGVGADKILKKSGTARELAGSLGMGGKLLKQYYDKEDSKDKKTGSEQTAQVVAKREGGMVRGGRAEIKGLRPAKLS
jgi:hypothetical protein